MLIVIEEMSVGGRLNINMGIRGGRDFNKVKVFFGSDRKGIFKRDNAELCAVGIDHADFFFADFIIDEQFLLSYCQTPPK